MKCLPLQREAFIRLLKGHKLPLAALIRRPQAQRLLLSSDTQRAETSTRKYILIPIN